jgi:hypothetical protein
MAPTQGMTHQLAVVDDNNDPSELEWDVWYAMLKNYNQRVGNCLVPFSYTEYGFKLGVWVSKQYDAYNNVNGDLQLRPDQRQALSSLGSFGFQRATEDAKIPVVVEMVGVVVASSAMASSMGANPIIESVAPDSGHVAASVLTPMISGEHAPPREERESMTQDFPGTDHGREQDEESSSEESSSEGSSSEGSSVHAEFDEESSEYEDDVLDDPEWAAMFSRLRDHKARFGDLKIESHDGEDDLCQWVEEQRQSFQRGEMHIDHVFQMNELNFEWNVKGQSWLHRFYQLKEFKSRFGHCGVPRSWEEDFAFGGWVYAQRRNHATLPAARQEMLKRLGLDKWGFGETRWSIMFNKLKAYNEKHGHCRVHKSFDDTLSNWINHQRQRNKRGDLKPGRKKKLEEIGFFANDARQIEWEKQFNKMMEYKARFDRFNVPISKVSDDDPSISRWLYYQRKTARSGTMPLDRRMRLNEVGFVWIPRDLASKRMTSSELWYMMLEQLKEFKQENKHCNVAIVTKNGRVTSDNAKLGKWVQNQRYLHGSGKLRLDREQDLRDVGFDFRDKRSLSS